MDAAALAAAVLPQRPLPALVSRPRQADPSPAAAVPSDGAASRSRAPPRAPPGRQVGEAWRWRPHPEPIWCLYHVTRPSLFLSQKAASVAAQILWEGSGGAGGQAGGPGLGFGRGLQQARQHAVAPRGAAEAAEGCGGRHRPETGEDPYEVGPDVFSSPVCALLGHGDRRTRDGDEPRDASHATRFTRTGRTGLICLTFDPLQ